MKEILPGILTWSVFSQEKGLDFNGHLVIGADGECALIDPPPLTVPGIETVERAGRPSVVVITNAHHTRDAVALSSRWNARILAPRLDAPLLPGGVHTGGTYGDGDVLPAGLQVISLSGQKTPGESALLCARSGALIVGDALIGRPPGSLGLLPDSKYADPKAARSGLRRLLEVPFEALLVGDGSSILREGRRAVEKFLSTL